MGRSGVVIASARHAALRGLGRLAQQSAGAGRDRFSPEVRRPPQVKKRKTAGESFRRETLPGLNLFRKGLFASESSSAVKCRFGYYQACNGSQQQTPRDLPRCLWKQGGCGQSGCLRACSLGLFRRSSQPLAHVVPWARSTRLAERREESRSGGESSGDRGSRLPDDGKSFAPYLAPARGQSASPTS